MYGDLWKCVTVLLTMYAFEALCYCVIVLCKCSTYLLTYVIRCVINSKKRVRDEEEGADSLPLSKRITLLHLDSNSRSAASYICLSLLAAPVDSTMYTCSSTCGDETHCCSTMKGCWFHCDGLKYVLVAGWIQRLVAVVVVEYQLWRTFCHWSNRILCSVFRCIVTTK